MGQIRPAEDTAYRLVPDPDELVHLVCCRAESWRTAFCGAECDDINPVATVACTMCLEEAEAMRPGCLAGAEIVCPVDGVPCPEDHEIDLRIARST